MSFSFSQPQTYPGLLPNELLDLERLRLAPQEAADVHQNRMLDARYSQRNISAFDMEQAGRIAGSVLDETTYPTPEARAAAWPTLIARARANGAILPHAPDTYPGDDVMRSTFRMAVPSTTQAEWQANIAANKAISAANTQPAATGTGGGTTAIGGTDTAPINAAGDSRTRKAGEGGPPAAGSPGYAVAKRTHDFWISKGFSEEQTAGIMAGGPGSESDFTPTAGGDKVNGVATSYGLYQHHAERLDNMRKFFGLSGSQMPSEDRQNQYAHWEITQGPLKNVSEMLKKAKTAAEAAAIWTQYFGVPADRTEIGRRAAGAQRFVGLYGAAQRAAQEARGASRRDDGAGG